MPIILVAAMVGACCQPWSEEARTPSRSNAARKSPTKAAAVHRPPSSTAVTMRPLAEPIAPAPKTISADAGKLADPAPREPVPTPVVANMQHAQLTPAPIKINATSPAVARIVPSVVAHDPAVVKLVSDLAGELSAKCPFSGPADEAAFADCQKALAGTSKVRASLAGPLLWGDGDKGGSQQLVQSGLSQLPMDDFAATYLPLFMFSGRHEISYSEQEKLFRVELGARLRNRLPTARLPEAFRKSDETWTALQRTSAVVFWIDPQKLSISAGQHIADSPIGNGPSAPAPKP